MVEDIKFEKYASIHCPLIACRDCRFALGVFFQKKRSQYWTGFGARRHLSVSLRLSDLSTDSVFCILDSGKFHELVREVAGHGLFNRVLYVL